MRKRKTPQPHVLDKAESLQGTALQIPPQSPQLLLGNLALVHGTLASNELAVKSSSLGKVGASVERRFPRREEGEDFVCVDKMVVDVFANQIRLGLDDELVDARGSVVLLLPSLLWVSGDAGFVMNGLDERPDEVVIGWGRIASLDLDKVVGSLVLTNNQAIAGAKVLGEFVATLVADIIWPIEEDGAEGKEDASARNLGVVSIAVLEAAPESNAAVAGESGLEVDHLLLQGGLVEIKRDIDKVKAKVVGLLNVGLVLGGVGGAQIDEVDGGALWHLLDNGTSGLLDDLGLVDGLVGVGGGLVPSLHVIGIGQLLGEKSIARSEESLLDAQGEVGFNKGGASNVDDRSVSNVRKSHCASDRGLLLLEEMKDSDGSQKQGE